MYPLQLAGASFQGQDQSELRYCIGVAAHRTGYFMEVPDKSRKPVDNNRLVMSFGFVPQAPDTWRAYGIP